MKKLKTYKQFINESIDLNTFEKRNGKYYPKDQEELKSLIDALIAERGNNGDFNDIDTSMITDMSGLFSYYRDFNGDISEWDVSNVTTMNSMFFECDDFNGDISRWNVSNVTNMNLMFNECLNFNRDISGWNVSNVKDMGGMFWGCAKFNQDLSKWNVLNVTSYDCIFLHCPIKEEFKPKMPELRKPNIKRPVRNNVNRNGKKNGLGVTSEEYFEIVTNWISDITNMSHDSAEDLARTYSEDIYSNYDNLIDAQDTAQEIVDSESKK